MNEFLSRPALDAIGAVPFDVGQLAAAQSAMAAAKKVATGNVPAKKKKALQPIEEEAAAGRVEVAERVAAASSLRRWHLSAVSTAP
jgi:hypothetical protein